MGEHARPAWRRSAWPAAAALLLAAAPGQARQLEPGACSPQAQRPTAGAAWEPEGMTILDPYLASRIHLLEERSPRFREAMLRARDSRIPIVLGTPDQLRQRTALPFLVHEKQATDRVGELLVQKCAPGSAGIRLIVVRVHLERLRSAARWPALLGRGRRWLDSTTDAVLIHEIWGHLTPILLAGDLSGTCPDPAPGQPPLESCVMQRENDLRRELGLKERRRYALRLPGT